MAEHSMSELSLEKQQELLERIEALEYENKKLKKINTAFEIPRKLFTSNESANYEICCAALV